MPPPRISVVIPVHDGEAFVAEAVDSVLAQARGTEPAEATELPLELLVVDDGSRDGTPRILAGFGDRITVLRQANRGLSAARNAGIGRARGELLFFLDADDLHPPGYLRRFLAAADAAPEADVFHAGWRGVDFAGRELYAQVTPLALDDDPFHRLPVHGSPHIAALGLRRRALARVGLFDERLRLQEDWDFWLRLAAAGAVFHGVPGAVATVRRRPGSMSSAAGAALALTGLQVLERQWRRHARCPACAGAAPGLERWRRIAVRSSAFELAGRLGLSGRAGRWIGTGLAVARTPRLLGPAWRELLAPFRSS